MWLMWLSCSLIRAQWALSKFEAVAYKVSCMQVPFAALTPRFKPLSFRLSIKVQQKKVLGLAISPSFDMHNGAVADSLRRRAEWLQHYSTTNGEEMAFLKRYITVMQRYSILLSRSDSPFSLLLILGPLSFDISSQLLLLDYASTIQPWQASSTLCGLLGDDIQ